MSTAVNDNERLPQAELARLNGHEQLALWLQSLLASPSSLAGVSPHPGPPSDPSPFSPARGGGGGGGGGTAGDWTGRDDDATKGDWGESDEEIEGDGNKDGGKVGETKVDGGWKSSAGDYDQLGASGRRVKGAAAGGVLCNKELTVYYRNQARVAYSPRHCESPTPLVTSATLPHSRVYTRVACSPSHARRLPPYFFYTKISHLPGSQLVQSAARTGPDGCKLPTFTSPPNSPRGAPPTSAHPRDFATYFHRALYPSPAGGG